MGSSAGPVDAPDLAPAPGREPFGPSFEYELPVDTAQLARTPTGQLLVVHRAEAPQAETAGYQENVQRRVFSIIAAGTGVLGLLASLFVGWAVPLSIAAIAFGVLGRRREEHGRTPALVGILTGIGGVAFAAIWIGYYIITLAPTLD
jgi:hypothetical protein